MRSKTVLFLVVLFGVISLFYSTRIGGRYYSIITSGLALVPPMLAWVYGFRAANTFNSTNKHRRSLQLISAGLLFWFLGELAFFFFQYMAHIDPFPSVADLSYIAGYVLLWAGLSMEIRINKASLKDFNQYIQFLIGLIMALLVGAVVYFGVFLAFVASEPLLNNIVVMSYGFGDLILIAPTLYVLKMAVDYRGGRLFMSWALILIALLLNLSADVSFAIYRNAYTMGLWPYNMIDIIWALTYMLFAYSFYATASHVREVRAKLRA